MPPTKRTEAPSDGTQNGVADNSNFYTQFLEGAELLCQTAAENERLVLEQRVNLEVAEATNNHLQTLVDRQKVRLEEMEKEMDAKHTYQCRYMEQRSLYKRKYNPSKEEQEEMRDKVKVLASGPVAKYRDERQAALETDAQEVDDLTTALGKKVQGIKASYKHMLQKVALSTSSPRVAVSAIGKKPVGGGKAAASGKKPPKEEDEKTSRKNTGYMRCWYSAEMQAQYKAEKAQAGDDFPKQWPTWFAPRWNALTKEQQQAWELPTAADASEEAPEKKASGKSAAAGKKPAAGGKSKAGASSAAAKAAAKALTAKADNYKPRAAGGKRAAARAEPASQKKDQTKQPQSPEVSGDEAEKKPKDDEGPEVVQLDDDDDDDDDENNDNNDNGSEAGDGQAEDEKAREEEEEKEKKEEDDDDDEDEELKKADPTNSDDEGSPKSRSASR